MNIRGYETRSEENQIDVESMLLLLLWDICGSVTIPWADAVKQAWVNQTCNPSSVREKETICFTGSGRVFDTCPPPQLSTWEDKDTKLMCSNIERWSQNKARLNLTWGYSSNCVHGLGTAAVYQFDYTSCMMASPVSVLYVNLECSRCWLSHWGNRH